MSHAPVPGITTAIVQFCRFARTHGLNVGVQESLDALAAAQAVTLTDKEDLFLALRALLCSCKAEWELFDDLFDVFWGASEYQQSTSGENQLSTANRHASPGESTEVWTHAREGQAGLAEDGQAVTTGASVQERLRQTDFSQLAQADLVLLEQLALRLWRQMSLRLARRTKALHAKDQLDLRRTIRRSVSRGGDPLDLCHTGKKRKKPQLVVLLDVSGSMEVYSSFLLWFIYALYKNFQRVAAFVFSTRLTPISQALQARRLSEVLAGLSHTQVGWSGGTRIGACLQDFNLVYGQRSLSRHCLFVLMSDGLDTGEPEVLAAELGKIKRQVRKLIWLNPLLGWQHYQPLARGMQAALPYTDVFAPAHNLESLLQLEHHLRVW